tara:strand:+ start:4056 stop:4208 length:153 start_codon:yes stop_codon:yes gene_type:complete
MAPNPDALWEDMSKLNSLYEELCWEPEDELEFGLAVVDSKQVIVIRNKDQ